MVKLSLYRLAQAFRKPEVEAPTISRQSAQDGKIVIPTPQPPLPQNILLVFLSLAESTTGL